MTSTSNQFGTCVCGRAEAGDAKRLKLNPLTRTQIRVNPPGAMKPKSPRAQMSNRAFQHCFKAFQELHVPRVAVVNCSLNDKGTSQNLALRKDA